VKIGVINGPNLNLLGIREIAIYGSESFESYFPKLEREFPSVIFSFFQSNIEGEIVDYIQNLHLKVDGLIINPGAFTHTSVAIRDALAILKFPIVEVHLSDINNREAFRKKSLIRDLTFTHIFGIGLLGYKTAVMRLLEWQLG
jgi:3-dehydroquinate dehydratase II